MAIIVIIFCYFSSNLDSYYLKVNTLKKSLATQVLARNTGWLKKSKLLTQYNSLLFLSHPVYQSYNSNKNNKNNKQFLWCCHQSHCTVHL